MIRKQTKILETDCTVYQLAIGNKQWAKPKMRHFADCQLPGVCCPLPIEIKKPSQE